MGNRGAKFAGLTEAPVALEDSIKGIIAQVRFTLCECPETRDRVD